MLHLVEILCLWDTGMVSEEGIAAQEQEVAPVIADYWERAEFPHQLVPRLAKLHLGGGVLEGHGCPGQSIMGAAIANVEMARVDGSMSTFLMVHNSLAMLTIGALL